MVMNWAEHVGSVACGWLLETHSAMRGPCACFYAVHTADSRRALVQFVPAVDEAAESFASSWDLAAKLNDQDLIAVYETGRTELDGTPVIYCAQEAPDDPIAAIAAGRSLDSDEARALTLSAAGALEYLHERGLKHGAVNAANLFLVDEHVKLGVDTLSPAPESERRSDLVQLGNLLLSSYPDLGGPGSPFRNIVRRSLDPDPRWTASSILAALNGGGADKPIVLPRTRKSPWILAGAGAIAIAGLIALFIFNRDAAPLLSEPASTAAAGDKPSPAVPFGTASRATLMTTPQRAGEADRSLEPKSTEKTWAVISATYRDYDAAQKRASTISRTASVQASVYPPKGQGARYYVILGSGMTQQEAEDLLAKALSSGAPGDSYVTKLVADKQ
jgi:eukaryotic-like serine/threonine-protein kinase